MQRVLAGFLIGMALGVATLDVYAGQPVPDSPPDFGSGKPVPDRPSDLGTLGMILNTFFLFLPLSGLVFLVIFLVLYLMWRG